MLREGLEQYRYGIQVSPMDCTGCGVCASMSCTAKALIMKDAEQEIMMESENYEFSLTVAEKDVMDKRC